MPRYPGYDTWTGRWCVCSHREEDHRIEVFNPADSAIPRCMVCECEEFRDRAALAEEKE